MEDMLSFSEEIRVDIADVDSVSAAISEDGDEITAAIDVAVGIPHERYSGPYIFTPSRETQTAACSGKLMSGNVVINPIPRNYGLITYNGFSLTVS